MDHLSTRRRFVQGAGIAGLGLLAGCGRQPWQAQQPRMPRVGLFHVGLDHVPPSLQSLREALQALGYEEGKTIVLDWRNLPDEDAARVTAREFVRDHVDLIVAFEDQTVRAAQAATAEIPIVFLHVNEPVAEGYVQSLAHPGGNLTGLTGGATPYPDKQLELFKEVVPTLHRVLLLSDPEDPTTPRVLRAVERAAMILQLELLQEPVTDQDGIERVFRALEPGQVDGIFLASQILHTRFNGVLIPLAQEKKLPMLGTPQEVERGALFAYGPNFTVIGRGTARYMDRILRGTKPADLPVEQESQLGFVINLRTAQALGLTIPQQVLLQATEVIQ